VKFGYRLAGSNGMIFMSKIPVSASTEFHNRIFDRFGRVEGDVAVRKGGLGLGLAIAKAYAELLGGTIRVESEPGKGSIFTVSLPCKISTETAEQISDAHSSSSNELQLKILIAEDDEINFIYLRELFANANFTILRASNGREAIISVCKTVISTCTDGLKMPGYERHRSIEEIRKKMPLPAGNCTNSLRHVGR
jgi:hypothetical protein